MTPITATPKTKPRTPPPTSPFSQTHPEVKRYTRAELLVGSTSIPPLQRLSDHTPGKQHHTLMDTPHARPIVDAQVFHSLKRETGERDEKREMRKHGQLFPTCSKRVTTWNARKKTHQVILCLWKAQSPSVLQPSSVGLNDTTQRTNRHVRKTTMIPSGPLKHGSFGVIGPLPTACHRFGVHMPPRAAAGNVRLNTKKHALDCLQTDTSHAGPDITAENKTHHTILPHRCTGHPTPQSTQHRHTAPPSSATTTHHRSRFPFLLSSFPTLTTHTTPRASFYLNYLKALTDNEGSQSQTICSKLVSAVGTEDQQGKQTECKRCQHGGQPVPLTKRGFLHMPKPVLGGKQEVPTRTARESPVRHSRNPGNTKAEGKSKVETGAEVNAARSATKPNPTYSRRPFWVQDTSPLMSCAVTDSCTTHVRAT